MHPNSRKQSRGRHKAVLQPGLSEGEDLSGLRSHSGMLGYVMAGALGDCCVTPALLVPQLHSASPAPSVGGFRTPRARTRTQEFREEGREELSQFEWIAL